MKMAKSKNGLVGEICLYGAQHCGFAFYATVPGAGGKGVEFIGKGGWNESEDTITGLLSSATEALFGGRTHFTERGVWKGVVRVYAPGGERFADMDLSKVQAFGDLEWKNAS
jgi:hypothetical protein